MKKSMKAAIGFTLIAAMVVVAAVVKVHTIDKDACTDCGLCVEVCPVDAISQVEYNGGTVHSIDPELCTNCGLCTEECPVDAISEIEVGATAKADDTKGADETK